MHRSRLVVPAAAALVAVAAAPMALASDHGIEHRESVLTELDATGEPEVSRIFTQVTVPAGEEVTIPGQSTAGFRTLLGEAKEDGDAVRFGPGLNRTVADNTAPLPVEVAVTYAVDGTDVAPEDVVGHDGEVAVTYIVRNLTAEPTELTVTDGDGVTSTESIEAAVPLVGSLSMTLPPAFRDVEAPGAVVVGDGRGNTVINWSLLLFAPLGSETAEVTWTALATDAVVPPVGLQVIPVTPASFGSFGSTQAAYSGAVDSTTELTEGAREIDANLELLAAGAGELLDGLVQLREGAAELAGGLVDAGTGAGELSAGLGQANAGAGDLADGLGDLSSGASQVAAGLVALDEGNSGLLQGLQRLSAGSGDLAAGAQDLADGSTLLDDNAAALAAGASEVATGAAGLQAGVEELNEQLLGSSGLPSAVAGIDQLQGGIGAEGTSGTILDGLAQVRDGLAAARSSLGEPTVPDTTLRYGAQQVNDGLAGVAGGNSSIATLATQLVASLTSVITNLSGVSGATAADDAAIGDALAALGDDATRAGTIEATAAGLDAAITGLQAGMGSVVGGLTVLADAIGDPSTAGTLRNGVLRITVGVSNPACDPANPTDPSNPCGVLEGLAALEQGLLDAQMAVEAGLGDPATPGNTLRYGASALADGSSELSTGASRLRNEGTAPLEAGAAELLDGAQQVAGGAAAAEDGAGELGAGTDQLVGGSEELATGAGTAEAGADELADGVRQLDTGAQELAAGLNTAEDGGRQLADGLGDAAAGGTEVAEGADQLQDEGTSVLADTVSEATVSSSVQLEQVQAVADRGTEGDGLPYPTVENAEASAVYQFDLAGVGTPRGPGVLGRLGVGVLALAAAAGLGALAGPRRSRGGLAAD